MSWRQPEGEDKGLKVYNSLTKSLVPFTPTSNEVRWYICGPTVYDESHIGHARTYVTFDIVRRILMEYFNYSLFYLMNVTDIDDKIIKRANDKGISIGEVTKANEKSFFNDMNALGCLYPDAVCRVSEHIPTIKDYLKRIMGKGLAYVAHGNEKTPGSGSVYFDVQKFMDSGRKYGKLRQNAVNEEQLVIEADGELTFFEEKRSTMDFALWKASKEGEPSWDDDTLVSGRPGWHIECSAMSDYYFGGHMEIHSGGVDLMFPHHENEMAQAEAYGDTDQWVDFFIHAGHLEIAGQKMSKSLKNFITVKDALTKYTSNQLRMFFALHKVNASLNYDGNSMQTAVDKEKYFKEFFLNVSTLLRETERKENDQAWDEVEFVLWKDFSITKKEVHEGICSNFNTPKVLASVSGLINKVYAYVDSRSGAELARIGLVESISLYIKHILELFGLQVVSSNVEDGKLPEVLDELLKFRQEVRQVKVEDGKVDFNESILPLCDRLRDEHLPSVGVRIEDKEGKSIWKLEDKEALMKELAEKKKIDEERRKKLQEEREQRKLQAAEREKRLAIEPRKFFKTTERDNWKEYDESGIPTRDKDGKEVSKSARKKLEKRLRAHSKAHEKFTKSREDSLK